jgi:hypothetical protein
MSKTWEHTKGVAHDHERSADQSKEVTKFHESEELEKAAHDAYVDHEVAAPRLNMEIWDGEPPAGVARKVKKENAA